jgi:hypothetical protein
MIVNTTMLLIEVNSHTPVRRKMDLKDFISNRNDYNKNKSKDKSKDGDLIDRSKID